MSTTNIKSDRAYLFVLSSDNQIFTSIPQQWEGIKMIQLIKHQLFGNAAYAMIVEANRLRPRFHDTNYTIIRMISRIIMTELVTFASPSLRLS